ncbi:MAG: hypothetical protein ABSC19_07065 [Syntrophorhabdales bacterium]
MRKFLIMVVALLLALPAMSFAGSATSQWDLTIGGYVKVDAGYSTQGIGGGDNVTSQGLDTYYAQRNNYHGAENSANSSGSFAMATGQTALNFLVKGPDAWGAKTSAFVQGSFTGQTNNDSATQSHGTRYGTFTLTHAYMDFTWASTKLVVGQTWQLWGFQPSYTFLGLNDLALEGRGSTVPQISVTQNLSKSFYGSFGIQEPYKMTDQLGVSNSTGEALQTTTTVKGVPTLTSNTPSVSSQLPDFAGEIGYKSDSCGRIGPNVMQFALGGFYGEDSVVYPLPATFRTDHVDRWATALKAFVPIIPEKNLNKAGALSLSGSVYTGQNLSNWFLNARGTGSLLAYDANPGPGVNYKVPVTTGGWGQVSYYITDKVYVNGLYGYLKNNTSSMYNLLNGNNIITQNQQYIANVIYDVTPAVRVGLEYSYIATHWAGPASAASVAVTDSASNVTGGPILGSRGDVQIGRVSFTYFF